MKNITRYGHSVYALFELVQANQCGKFKHSEDDMHTRQLFIQHIYDQLEQPLSVAGDLPASTALE